MGMQRYKIYYRVLKQLIVIPVDLNVFFVGHSPKNIGPYENENHIKGIKYLATDMLCFNMNIPHMQEALNDFFSELHDADEYPFGTVPGVHVFGFYDPPILNHNAALSCGAELAYRPAITLIEAPKSSRFARRSRCCNMQ